MQTNSNESSANLAKHFVRSAILKQYGSDYSNCDDLIEFAAYDFLKEYTLANGNGAGRKIAASPVDQSVFLDGGEASASVFPQDFNVDIAIGSIQIHVTNPQSGKYVATVKTKVLGVQLGESQLEFDNGSLSRSETIGKGPLEYKYQITLSFSSGFHLRYEGDGYVDYWLGKKKFHVGPYDLNT